MVWSELSKQRRYLKREPSNISEIVGLPRKHQFCLTNIDNDMSVCALSIQRNKKMALSNLSKNNKHTLLVKNQHIRIGPCYNPEWKVRKKMLFV